MSRNAKPRKQYRPRPLQSWIPTTLRNAVEIMAHFLAPKLAAGLFNDVDGNSLAYMLNVSRRMAVEGGYQNMISMVDVCMEAFLGIRKRKERIGKWGAAGEELLVLEETLPNIAAWFLTQPVHRIERARQFVLAVNQKMMAVGALFADVTDSGQLENLVTEVAA